MDLPAADYALRVVSTLTIGGDMTVRRIGYGAMALTGLGGWGEPPVH